jgi:protein-tyrosine-phosphatase
VEGNAVKAAQVIKEARAAGVRIALDRDGLSLEATAAPSEAMIELIAQHKAEIVDLLRSRGPAEVEVSWLDMVVAVENEAGRHRIWRDELIRRAADDGLAPGERDNHEQAIASRARYAAIFDAVLRVVERARAESVDDDVWNE